MKSVEEPIVVEEIFNAPIDEVWEAITELDKMKKWYFPDIPSFKAELGFETEFIVPIGDRVFHHLWKITEVIPFNKISYLWSYKAYPGSGISRFELMEHPSGSKLRLTFTVLEPFPDDIPEFKRDSGLEGWNYFIKERLKHYLEK